MQTSSDVIKELSKSADPDKASFFPKFFRTGKGEYGEGDKFIGVTVPNQRKLAKKFRDIDFKELQKLINSPVHEHRLVSLFILVLKYEKGDNKQKKAVVAFYLNNLNGVNNWDLVDSSAHKILGPWLLDKDRGMLYEYARSGHLWLQRISIITTLHFIRNNQLDDTYLISEILLGHDHYLIHKAVGWMLREAGKKDVIRLIEFLEDHYSVIPRTTLRYSIEKFDKKRRKKILDGDFSK